MVLALSRIEIFSIIALGACIYSYQCLQEEEVQTRLQGRDDQTDFVNSRSVNDLRFYSCFSQTSDRSELNFDIRPWPKRRPRFSFSN
jgi:hypothetical protein